MMTENAGVEAPVGTEAPSVESNAPDTSPATQQNSGDNGEVRDNPAWEPFLQVIPTQLHGQIKPVLKTWDQGINEKFQEIHQRYEPYKQFVDDGVTADQVRQSYQLLQALENNPEAFYKEMGQYYGYVGTGGQESSQQTPPTVESSDDQTEFDFGTPEANTAWKGMQSQLAEQSQIIQTMAQILTGAQEMTANSEADKALDTALSAAREKHGNFDENYVLALVANGMDIDQAVEQYSSAINTALTERNRPPAPQVLGGANGSLPTNAVDITKLSQRETQNLVAEMARKAATGA